MSNYISIGKFVAVHGIKGELILKHALGKKTNLKGLKALFTEENENSYIPWFIKGANGRSEAEVLVALEDILSPESARKLNQKTVWITKEDFEKQVSKTAPISFIGFEVVENDQVIGIISEVIEQPHQILCTVLINDKEALIPLHQESLQSVDRSKRQIHVSLPSGLLDIYLQ